MPSRIMPGLGLRAGYTAGESGWGTPMTEDLRTLSAVVQLTVQSMTTVLPTPGSAGDIYIVPSADPDEFMVAVWDDADWQLIPPALGWLAFVIDDNQHVFFNGTTWEVFGAAATIPSFDAFDVGKVLTVDYGGGSMSWQYPRMTTVITYAGTALTLDYNHFAGDVIIKCTSSSAVVITVPDGIDMVEAVTIVRFGTGSVQVVGSVAVVNSADGRDMLRSQYSTASIIPVGADEYLLVGDIEA